MTNVLYLFNYRAGRNVCRITCGTFRLLPHWSCIQCLHCRRKTNNILSKHNKSPNPIDTTGKIAKNWWGHKQITYRYRIFKSKPFYCVRHFIKLRRSKGKITTETSSIACLTFDDFVFCFILYYYHFALINHDVIQIVSGNSLKIVAEMIWYLATNDSVQTEIILHSRRIVLSL